MRPIFLRFVIVFVLFVGTLLVARLLAAIVATYFGKLGCVITCCINVRLNFVPI
jgi:hypothetical protein